MWHFSWFFACQISLKCQKCILLLPFFGPPPLLILFWDFARNTYSRGIVPLFLGSLYNLCTIKAVLLAPRNFKIQPLPKGGGPMNEATFGILRTINPKFDPTKDNRVKPFEVWCKLVSPLLSHTDCQKCTRSRPWPVLSSSCDQNWLPHGRMKFVYLTKLSGVQMSLSPGEIFCKSGFIW